MAGSVSKYSRYSWIWSQLAFIVSTQMYMIVLLLLCGWNQCCLRYSHKGERTDGTSCSMGVHKDFLIDQEVEICFLILVARRCFVCAASNDYFWNGLFYLCKINVNFMRCLMLTINVPVFIFEFVEKLV